jgi:hypothetical protein
MEKVAYGSTLGEPHKGSTQQACRKAKGLAGEKNVRASAQLPGGRCPRPAPAAPLSLSLSLSLSLTGALPSPWPDPCGFFIEAPCLVNEEHGASLRRCRRRGRSGWRLQLCCRRQAKGWSQGLRRA